MEIEGRVVYFYYILFVQLKVSFLLSLQIKHSIESLRATNQNTIKSSSKSMRLLTQIQTQTQTPHTLSYEFPMTSENCWENKAKMIFLEDCSKVRTQYPLVPLLSHFPYDL